MQQGDAGYRIAEVLLRSGASPDALPNDDRQLDGPLQDAAKRGCSAAVALLLRYGADPDRRDGTGSAPLHALCRQTPYHIDGTHMQVLRILLRGGAKPNVLDADGRPPSTYAFSFGLRAALSEAERAWSARALSIALGQRPKLLPEVWHAVLAWV